MLELGKGGKNCQKLMEQDNKVRKRLQMYKQAYSHFFYLFSNIKKSLLSKKNFYSYKNCKKTISLSPKLAYLYFQKF